MRRLLLILSILLFAFQLEGQIINARNNYVAPVTGSSYCAEYQAVYNAMTTKPTTYDDNQNTLVEELKTAGAWAAGDCFYVLAQETNGAGEAWINWIDPGTYDITDPSSTNPSFTANEGFTGDGSSDWLETSFNYSSSHLTLNSTTIAFYSRTQTANDAFAVGRISTNYIAVAPDLYNNFWYILNRGDGTLSANTDSRGFFTAVRRGAAETEGYKNGGHVMDGTEASVALPGGSIRLFAIGDGGFSNVQLSIIYIGGALTDQQVADMNTAVEKYMDALGKGVE